jgi:Flp pilus assembly protein TadD
MPATLASRLPTLAAAVCCAACAFWLGGQAIEAGRIHQANDLGLQGRPAAALAKATGASRGARIRAVAAAQLGRFDEADRALRQAIDRAPNDWSAHRDRAVLLQQLGRTAPAAAELSRALALNPRLRLPAGFVIDSSGHAP